MYTTIEADIENGVLKGAEVKNIPVRAHVLITLLPGRNDQKRQEATQVANRKPDPTLRGCIKINGDIMDSAPSLSWNLPS